MTIQYSSADNAGAANGYAYTGGANTSEFVNLGLDDMSGPIDKDQLLRCACPSCVKTALKNGLDPAILEEWGLSRPAVGPDALVGVNGDEVPDTPHNDARFTLSTEPGARPIESRVNDGLDRDLFRVELKAGETYQFDLTGKTGSGDFVLELVDANGLPVLGPDNMPLQSDGSGAEGEERIVFTPSADGAYFVSVRSFTPTDVGNYAVSAKVADPDAGDGGSVVPTDSIDWGGTANRVDTARAPGGDPDAIDVYFARTGEIYQGLAVDAAIDWNAYEKGQAMIALQQYANVANVNFRITEVRSEAEFVLVKNATAPVLLGRMSPPGEENEGQGEFNSLGVGWSSAAGGGLEQGGYGFITLIHEFGHGMGLAHPHDNGGGSTVMRDVDSDSSPGFMNFNQGVYTTMSYRSGRPDGPDGDPEDTAAENEAPGTQEYSYGYEGTLSAFDIAVIQAKYGVNTSFRTGDDIYLIKDVNAAGTFYEGIWDAGGSDTVRYDGARNSVIDLRPATLGYEAGGGGFVSHAFGVHGGFTIANGVVIENAVGGAGADLITGNAAANRLEGNAGSDRLFGGEGDDVLLGGADNDFLQGNQGADRLFGGDGDDQLVGGQGDDTLQGNQGADTLQGNIGADTLLGGGGNDSLFGGTENDRLLGDLGDDFLQGNQGADTLSGGEGNDTLLGGADNDDLNGGNGADRLFGDRGQDVMNGGAGADRFAFSSVVDSAVGASDRIVDFSAAEGDLIDLTAIDADTGAAGDQAFSFVDAFSGRAGQAVLSFDAAANTTTLSLDVDGDGQADFALFMVGQVNTVESFAL